MNINERFLNKYNFLESILSKNFFPKDNPFGVISILERLSIEPHSTHLKTLRETRNLLVHSTRIKSSQPFFVSYKVEEYLDEIISFVQTNESNLHEQYIKHYIKKNITHSPKTGKTMTNMISEIYSSPEEKKTITPTKKSFFKKKKIKIKSFNSPQKNIPFRKKNESTNSEYNYQQKSIKEAISIIKKWSNSDKIAILNSYSIKRNIFKSLNQQLAEVLINAKVTIE